jgi:antitoxin component YwqK of YwqJK toxin-antitoxin module
VTRPHEKDKNAGTAGYVTAAQGPNGVIHILTTKTKPSLHYELNEAWILSKIAGDMDPETTGGKIKHYTDYSGGKLHARWSARITPSGRYLLDGEKVTYYPNGKVESRSTYENGRPLEQTYWSPAGVKLWAWTYDNKNDTAVWTKYWANGNKKVVSNWLTNPELKTTQGDRKIYCKIANGLATLFNQDGSIKETNTFNMGCIGDAGSCLVGGWY